MDPLLVAGIGLGAMALLILLHVPVGFAMMVVGAGGFWITQNSLMPALSLFGSEATHVFSNLELATIPLFLLMGSFANVAGLSTEIYTLASRTIGHVRGGIALATIGGCGVFGAVCGSSVATAATFGRIALPEMIGRGYAPSFAAGTVAAGGTLGAIVPPSTIMIIYAVVTHSFILDLFIAAIVPAVIAVGLYAFAIAIYLRIYPEAAPTLERTSWRERLRAIRDSYAVVLFILIVLGGLYGGVFTVIEAASVGTALAFGLGIVRRRLTWQTFWQALGETASNTAMIYLIIVGAFVLSYFVTVSHAAEALAAFVNGLDVAPVAVIFVLLIIYLILGAISDTVSAMLITLPFVLPIIVSLGYDPIWWGIINVVVIELGMITPPIGMNVFVLHGVARDIPLATIFRGVTPFVIADVVRLSVLTLFPGLTLWLLHAIR